MNKIEKPWGYEEILEQNNEYVVKRLFMKANKRCSLQYHKVKHETIYVLAGDINIQIEEETQCFKRGDSITIPPGIKHRMSTIGGEECLYLEASTPQLDDVVRLEDDYNR